MKGVAARGSAQLGIEGAFAAATGYIGLLLLAHSLGPAEFGLYGVIVSFIVWVERTTMLDIPGAVTKLISEGKQAAAATSLIMSLVLIGTVTVTLLLFAPALANLFRVPGREALFRIAALDIPLSGLFLLYRGVAMGNHGFGKVLISGLVLGSVKVVAVAWIVFAGYGTFGALVAYVIGSLAGLVLLVMYLPIRLNRPDRDIAQAILAIALPFTISNLGLSIIHSLDLWILKALAVPDMDRDIGVYAATRVLARTPEVVLLPIATVLFPVISKSLARNEMREAVDHIKGAMRALWLILLPTAAFAAVDAESILRLFFPESYYGGGAFLSLQIAAFCMLTALGTLLVVLRARGDFYSIVFSGLALPVLLSVLTFVLVPRYGTLGAAFSFVATSVIGLIVLGVLVYRRFGALMSKSVLIKGAIATAVLLPAVSLVSAAGIWLIAKYAVIAVVYAGLLWAMKELRSEDLKPILLWR